MPSITGAIAESELAQLTGRAGVARAGCSRTGCAPKIYDLKSGALAGQILIDRPVARDGDPDDTLGTYTTGRE